MAVFVVVMIQVRKQMRGRSRVRGMVCEDGATNIAQTYGGYTSLPVSEQEGQECELLRPCSIAVANSLLQTP